MLDENDLNTLRHHTESLGISIIKTLIQLLLMTIKRVNTEYLVETGKKVHVFARETILIQHDSAITNRNPSYAGHLYQKMNPPTMSWKFLLGTELRCQIMCLIRLFHIVLFPVLGVQLR